MLEISKVENIIQKVLQELGFNVRQHYVFDQSFEVDFLATRSGLTVLIDLVQQDPLTFDSVAKLKTVGSYLIDKFGLLSLREVVITTASKISKDIRRFAEENDILLLEVELKEKEIKDKIAQINFLKSIPLRQEIDIIKIIENELDRSGHLLSMKLLEKIREWYAQGGKKRIAKEVMNEINELKEKYRWENDQ